MKVEIWSDVVCPWCYIGKRRFEQALARFEHAADVEVVWRAFELDPPAPVERQGDYAVRLAEKYGTAIAEAQQMLDTMTQAAAAEGLDFHFERARVGNTFDAHRLLHLAGERGVQDAVKERLLRAAFVEGEPVGDAETLVRLVSEAGLSADEARRVLADGTYGDDVRGEQRESQSLGISGVPFFVIDRRYGISGAQPTELLLQALEQAWSERAPLRVLSGSAGSCAGDACVV
jgi:predicted DsbA family dithiol-disulfide isomerase